MFLAAKRADGWGVGIPPNFPQKDSALHLVVGKVVFNCFLVACGCGRFLLPDPGLD